MGNPVTVLLRPGRIAALRFLSPKEKGGVARLVLGLLLAAAIGGVVFYITFRALKFFSGVEVIGLVLTARLLDFMLLGVLGFVFLSSLVSALATFFLADDLQLVRAAPLREGGFFMARWLQTTALSAWMVLGFGVPLLLAYGYALGGGAVFWLTSLLSFLPLLLIPTALGVGLMSVLVCVFPARKIRDLFVVLGVVTAALLLLLFRMAQPERLMRPEVYGSVANYVAAFEVPQNALLPSSWAGEALQAAMTGRFDWGSIGLLWATVWGLASFAFLIHKRLYRLAYSRAQEGGPGSYASFTWLEAMFDRLQARLVPESRAFARKDTKMLLRDPGQWSQLLILMTLIVAYVYNYAVYPGADRKIANIEVNHLLGILNLVLASFVVSALVARFAFPAVSIEGRAFWLVRTSPLPPGRFLAIKFKLALLPLLPIATLLAGLTAYWLKLAWPLVAVTVLHMGVATFVMTALGLGLGALYPKFKFENPAQVPMSFGGIIFMLLATGYAVLMSLATAWLAVPMAIGSVSRSPGLTIFGWAIWLTFNLALAMIPLRLASRALAQKEYV